MSRLPKPDKYYAVTNFLHLATLACNNEMKTVFLLLIDTTTYGTYPFFDTSHKIEVPQ